ncbi:lipopolysaccharide biosynthesis protein [Agrobacterium sp. NPDC090273]|uniref:lipopolysaccharide biosynthesis protein n=1 Tax=Agrobacterium sp. NPDC090273 TaxID=3363919 RepID=UPI00383AE02D
MRPLGAAKSISNLGLRGFTLVFRFVLSFYIVKYLGLDATGIYGLAVGVISFVPAFVGWGLNYFVARDLVGQTREFAGVRVKSRLMVTTVSLGVVTIIGLGITVVLGLDVKRIHLLILMLLWLETYALDIHIPMIAQDMSIQANILVFFRSALWVPLVIGAGVLLPEFRSIEWVFLGWILSYIPTLFALMYFIRQWPFNEIVRAPIHNEWLRSRLKTSWIIYVSDLCLVGLMYADRYVVNLVLGLTLTGIYTFFWTLTNSLQTLISTAVVQVALPILFRAHNEGTSTDWRKAMREQFLKTAAMSMVLSFGIFAACEILIHLMDLHQIADHRGLFIMMLLAAVVRSCSDILSTGLTSLRKDRHYALINMVGVVLTVSVAYAMMMIFGLDGAGIAALTSALLIATAKAVYLVKFATTMKGPDHA